MFHGERFAEVDGGVGGVWILHRPLDEGNLEYNGCVAAAAQIQEQQGRTAVRLYVQMPPDKFGVSFRGSMPAFVLHKGLIGTQVDLHRAAADRTAGNQLRRDTHVLLLRYHLFDGLLVVVGLLMTGFRALEQAVVALCVEQPLFIKSCLLELMIDVGGDDEIVLVFQQFEQIVIDGLWGGHVAVEIDVAAPVGPMFLLGGKWIEARRVHIGEAVLADEVGKVLLESLARIGKPRRGGKSRASAHDNSVGGLQCFS